MPNQDGVNLGEIEMNRTQTFFITLVILAIPAGRALAADEPWPSRPIKIVVPASPGAGSDVAARVLANGITSELGQSVVTVNVVGPASVAGANVVAHAKADGYTLLTTNVVPVGVIQNFRNDMPYELADLAPVSQTDQSSQILVVNPQKFAVRSVPELVELLKKDPGKYNFGSAGIGQMNHLSVELFMQKTGTKMIHVPYKGSGESALALVGGTIDFVIDGTGSFWPHVQAGRLRALAVATPVRQPEMPDLPTITELIPDFPGFYTWRAIYVPRGTPQAIINRLNKVIAEFSHSPDGIAKMKALSATAVSSTPQELSELAKRDSAIWSEVIKSANIKLE
jgi:tripartite-type tricarboxylate transporter receptor subunit TctC